MSQAELDLTASKSFQDRRRSEPRVECEREISLLPCSGDGAHFLKAELTDCSVHGLGLLLPQAIEAGQQVLMRIDVDRQPTLFLYTIRYCIPITPQQFRAGARFSGFVANRFRGEMKSVITTLAGRP